MPAVRDVSEAEFQAAVIDRSNDVAVVVDFWAPWCGPCRQLGPALERAVEATAGEVELVKVNVDENPGLSQAFGVQGIPAVFALRDAQVVSHFVGAQPEAAVREFVESLLPTDAERQTVAGIGALEAGDLAGAEAAFRAALEALPNFDPAKLGLAEVLVRSDRVNEGLELLAGLPETDDVRRVRGLARVADVSDDGDLDELRRAAMSDPAARLRLATALAAAGQEEEAIDTYVGLVRGRDEHADDARSALLDLFALLGDTDERVVTGRRSLASALF